jgi:hypothetical protein
MKYTANNEESWDMVAFNVVGDEFQMDTILHDNRYYYSDLVLFEGGESLDVQSQVVVDSSVIKAPWG